MCIYQFQWYLGSLDFGIRLLCLRLSIESGFERDKESAGSVLGLLASN